MSIVKNFILEFYYTFKFGIHNKKIFKNNNKNSNDIVIIEVNRIYSSFIAYSYICNALREKNGCKIYLFKSHFFKTFFGEFFHLILLKFNLFHYKIYNTFGDTSLLFYKKKNKLKKYETYFKKIKNNNDLINFKINNIVIGDLIYDSYLRWFGKPTINLHDEDFKFFFLKSIDYYFFCNSIFEKYNVKCVILSHTVYLPAIMGRIALKKNKNFYCLSVSHCVSLSKNHFFIEDYSLYKKLFDKLKKK